MWTKESIEKFMVDFGFKPRKTQPEIKDLPTILYPDEKLHGLIEGVLTRVHNREINGNGLVIATNKRIIFFRKSFLGIVTKEEIPITKVSSSSFRKGLMFSSVAIIASNNEAVVEYCDKDIGRRFNDTVQKLISNLETHTEHSVTQNNSQVSRTSSSGIEQLEKLFDLKQKGILTEEEYAAQKAKLLG